MLPQSDTSSSILRKTLSKTSNTYAGGHYKQRDFTHCVAEGCRNSEREHPGKVYYVFPKQSSLRSQWLQLIKRTDLSEQLAFSSSRDQRVCSDHFAPFQYTSKGSLRDDALPSLLPPYNRDVAGDETLEPAVQVKREPTEEIQIEFHTEPSTSQRPDPIAEPLPVKTGTECEIDPLSVVKSEPRKTTTRASQTFTRKELYLKTAVGTELEQIHLPRISTDIVKRHVSLQTTKNLIAHFTTPVKRQLQVEIREVNKRAKLMDRVALDQKTFVSCCDKYLDENIAYIVKTDSHLQDKFVGNRYSYEFKTFAINLYLSNPQSYRFLENIINLPSRPTLKRLQTPARTGTNPNLMEYLKVKASKMTEKEKVCAICFDVMRISKNLWYEVCNDFLCGMQEIDQVMGPEPAAYAAVLMVRGFYTKWTQPISYAFVTEKRCYPELKEWTHKIIGQMFDVGLNIKAFVSDVETEFMDVVVKPNSEHYFEIDDRKIYHFYDVRYLFKSVRDALMQYDFHVGSKVVKWDHIVKVYDKDKNHDLSLMPEITSKHMRPTSQSLDDVDLAMQVFSKAVAAAMHFQVTANMVNAKAKYTVEFIAKMSDLVDILTSKSLARAYKGTAEQNQVLLDILAYLQGLQVRDCHDHVVDVRFINGLIVNIKSVMSLLELKMEIPYLFTKSLSKECVEAFFDECRRLGGNCCERPTSIMFARFFRRLFLVNIFNTKDGKNEQDLKSALYKFGEYVTAESGKKDEPQLELNKRMLSGVSDYKIQWPSTAYIAGYLLWKCLDKHKCDTFIEKLSSNYGIPVENGAATLLKHFRKYNAENINNGHLLKPPEFLVEFVDVIDRKYSEYLSRTDRQPVNFAWNCYCYMEEDTFDMPCDCFPLQFMKILFIRLKIEHCIREYNRTNKNSRRARPQTKKQSNKKNK